jgi:hypothetical protein
MDAGSFAMIAFSICNAARVLAYIPQITRIARDGEGAAAVSSTTWMLFAVANASTVVYASFTIHDVTMALLFAANTLSCLVIAGLTTFKRRRYASLQIIPAHSRARASSM